jgi:hypothetical protein
MRRVQQAAYPMVKLTQAEIAAMIGRREERRRLAEVRQVHPLISRRTGSGLFLLIKYLKLVLEFGQIGNIESAVDSNLFVFVTHFWKHL